MKKTRREWLVELRTAAGLSQRDLVKLISNTNGSFTQQHLSNYECGNTSIDLDRFDLLIRAIHDYYIAQARRYLALRKELFPAE